MLQVVEHRTLLGKVGKGIVVAAEVYQAFRFRRNGDARNGGKLFHNTHFTTDRVRLEK